MLKTRVAFPSFAIGSFLYLGISIYLATKGKVIFFSESCFFFSLLIFAILSKQLRRFVHDWGIFLAIIFLFENLRGAIYIFNQKIGNLPKFNYVIIADQWLLQGYTLPALLQKLFPIETHPKLVAFAVLMYALHFFFFIAFGFFIWLKKPDSFNRYVIAFILLMFLGLLLYLIFPTAPPWLASRLGYIPPLDQRNAELASLTKYFTPGLIKVFMTNPVAAMPSLHAAFPSLCYFVAQHQHKQLATVFGLYLIAVYFACGYTNAHYLVDLLAGSLLAYLIYLLVYARKYLPIFSMQKLEKLLGDRDNIFTRCYVALFILFQSQLVFLYSIAYTQ